MKYVSVADNGTQHAYLNKAPLLTGLYNHKHFNALKESHTKGSEETGAVLKALSTFSLPVHDTMQVNIFLWLTHFSSPVPVEIEQCVGSGSDGLCQKLHPDKEVPMNVCPTGLHQAPSGQIQLTRSSPGYALG